MHYSGYMQDLSQLIEDCLLPISNTDVALIDNSLQDSKVSCPNDLSTSTLQTMLLLDKAVVPDSKADKAADLPSLPTSYDSEASEKATSIATSIYDLTTTMMPPLVEKRPLEQRGLPTMSSSTLQKKVPLESATNLVVSPRSTQSPILTAQGEPIFKMAMPISPTNQSLPRATALATRKTDEVMADLKRPSKAPRTSPQNLKHRNISFASEAAKSESTISDLPAAELYSAAKGHANPDEDGSIEDDESSGDDEIQPTAKPWRITERKRRLNAVADSYMQERTQKQLKEGNKIRPEDESQQSARWLVNQSENREIISSPREYQVELFEKAKEKNTIAVLDTGSYLLSDPHSPTDKSRFWQDFDCCPPSSTHVRPGARR
jgi:endoribonuclease Dicer